MIDIEKAREEFYEIKKSVIGKPLNRRLIDETRERILLFIESLRLQDLRFVIHADFDTGSIEIQPIRPIDALAIHALTK